jgi:hypothetical protein
MRNLTAVLVDSDVVNRPTCAELLSSGDKSTH